MTALLKSGSTKPANIPKRDKDTKLTVQNVSGKLINI